VRAVIQEKWPSLINKKGILFYHDNAKPHTSNITQKKLFELGWELLSHPAYSPDIALSDYHFILCKTVWQEKI